MKLLMAQVPPLPRIDSDEQYARLLYRGEFWEPYARAALVRVGIPAADTFEIRVVGTYPTLVTDTVVVKLFGDRWSGAESHQAEREAFAVMAGSGLPVPQLLAAGELYPQESWHWPYFILSRVEGMTYAELEDRLDDTARSEVAGCIAAVLKVVHEQPLLPDAKYLRPDWERFLGLLKRRRQEAAADHLRWANLPERLCRQIDPFLPDPRELVDVSRLPVFIHGDLHADHLFLDPERGEVTALIDFTDAYAGDPRYDLVGLHFGTFRCRKDMLSAFLGNYGRKPEMDTWPEVMLAFTLLHDFNMFDAYTPDDFDGIESLADLAYRIWNPHYPELGAER